MIEIRYNINSGEITGWCGESEQFGRLKNRPDEAREIVDLPVPDGAIDSVLYDDVTKEIKANPGYIPPKQPKLEALITELKGKGVID